MSKIELVKGSCADQKVDVIVNAANRHLAKGGGICGVIFKRAGSALLEEACGKYVTPLEDGDAVITPAYGIKNAKTIIHAVGPDFSKKPNAFQKQEDAYYNALLLMKDFGYHSISFPLISSGIFAGNLPDPVGFSTKSCLFAYRKFYTESPNYEADVFLCAFTDEEYARAYEVYDFYENSMGYDRWDVGGEGVSPATKPYPGK